MIAANVSNSNCIPFSCFYNDSTILTKNGSLVKVIKVPYARGTLDDTEIRASLRSIISKVINSLEHNFAFWVTTVRKKRELKIENESAADNFSLSLSKRYGNTIELQERFHTELYISIVSESILKKVGKLSDFFLLQSIKCTQNYGDKLLSAINKATDDTLSSIIKYSPILLKFEEIGRASCRERVCLYV